MSQETVEKVLGRMITDDGFRLRAAENMHRACWEERYALSELELRQVMKVEVEQLSFIAQNIEGSIKRYATAIPGAR